MTGAPLQRVVIERTVDGWRVLRDSRPVRVGRRHMRIRYPTMRHLARMRWVDLVGGPGDWTATITPEGIMRLWRHHMYRRLRPRTAAAKDGQRT